MSHFAFLGCYSHYVIKHTQCGNKTHNLVIRNNIWFALFSGPRGLICLVLLRNWRKICIWKGNWNIIFWIVTKVTQKSMFLRPQRAWGSLSANRQWQAENTLGLRPFSREHKLSYSSFIYINLYSWVLGMLCCKRSPTVVKACPREQAVQWRILKNLFLEMQILCLLLKQRNSVKTEIWIPKTCLQVLKCQYWYCRSTYWELVRSRSK